MFMSDMFRNPHDKDRWLNTVLVLSKYFCTAVHEVIQLEHENKTFPSSY